MTRPSVSVVRRLVAACAVTTALAVVVALSNGATGRPAGAAPAFLAAGAICAALVTHLARAAARAVGDGRLRWMAAGAAVACLGLLANLSGQASVFPNGGPVTQSVDALTARYLAWHTALALAAVLAVAGVRATRTRLAGLVAAGAGVLAYASAASAPFGQLVTEGGYSFAVKVAVAVLVVVLAGAAAAWWRSEGRVPPWAAVCMIAALGLAAADGVAYLFAEEPFAGAWWASTTLRTGQFAIPAVGLVIGFVGLADRLRELQREVRDNFAAEQERAARADALAGSDRIRRERVRAGIERLIAGEGLDVALQPIVDLGSGRVVGAEALARFTGPGGERVPTEECFLDAYAVCLGEELELAAVRLALAAHDRLADGLYLAVNVSPGLVAGSALADVLIAHERRPLVVELTEHRAVEDYAALAAGLERLRAHGIRLAIDDVGSGFSSFRHVTRVNPEILKLDRTLVCGIDDDPVRQSLAAAIVSFARDVGAVVVSEGIESEAELSCLRELAVGCGQGFLIGRPGLGAVDALEAA